MFGRTLIISSAGDHHAYAIAEGLRRKGAAAALWYTSDFPVLAGESVRFVGGQWSLRATNAAVSGDSGEFTTVWSRRNHYALDDDVLHPSDLEFARQNCETFRDSLFGTSYPNAFWVNPYDTARRLTKMREHRTAVAVGLVTPDTLYSNDPDEIRRFIRDQGGRIVYKPLVMMAWRRGGAYIAPYTTALTEDRLVDDDVLRMVPGIYQALVPKRYELRVTVMGRRVVGTRILSQQTRRGQLDWRQAYGELTMEPADLPDPIAERCRALLDRLGLVFGCIDLIVTPTGEHVFLEVNQMGQFRFLEHYTRQPLLDMFCELLRQGRPDFAWPTGDRVLRFEDVEAAAAAWRARDLEQHRASPDPAIADDAPDRPHGA